MRTIYPSDSVPLYKLRFSFSEFVSLVDLINTTPGLPPIETLSALYVKLTNAIVYRISFKHIILSFVRGPLFTTAQEYRFECYICKTGRYGSRGKVITAVYDCKYCVVNRESSAAIAYARNKERKLKRTNKLR